MKCQKLVERCLESGLYVATMESCTGGGLANAITNTPRSSEVFQFGTVTYHNDAKVAQGVPKRVIDQYTVYSQETAKEMAAAALHSLSDSMWLNLIGIGTTGNLTRTDPANEEASVLGEVHIGIAHYLGGSLDRIAYTIRVDETDRALAKDIVITKCQELALESIDTFYRKR